MRREGALVESSSTTLMTLLIILISLLGTSLGLLPVQENEYREYDDLDGLWTFALGDQVDLTSRGPPRPQMSDISFWENSTTMPVPSSYNDLSAVNGLRDHVGYVYYQTHFYIQKADLDYTFVLRFGSVNYKCRVFFNDYYLGEHEGAHVPFEFEIVPAAIKFGAKNRLTVAVTNVLSGITIPQGKVVELPREPADKTKKYKLETNAHYFHYAGILRSVYLLKFLSKYYLKDIDYSANDKTIDYNLMFSQSYNSSKFTAKSFIYMPSTVATQWDHRGEKVLEADGEHINNSPNRLDALWWPRGMGNQTLLTLEVHLFANVSGKITPIDVYRTKIGMRSVSVSKDQKHILINGKPFYCAGFGIHEDFEFSGRAYDPMAMIKDLTLLEWSEVNCVRTYNPVAEEMMQEFDRRGIAVIVNSAAVGINGYSSNLYKRHLEVMKETMLRDRKHPSAIMWSLASNPDTNDPKRTYYFNKLAKEVRKAENDRDRVENVRLFTISYGENSLTDAFNIEPTVSAVDVIGVSRFYGWTEDYGHLERVGSSLRFDLAVIQDLHNKPILLNGYGAESTFGKSQMEYSDSYHMDVLSRNHQALDHLRKHKRIAGELLECLADFTPANSTLNTGYGGVFTKSREPKGAAYVMRERYRSLGTLALHVEESGVRPNPEVPPSGSRDQCYEQLEDCTY